MHKEQGGDTADPRCPKGCSSPQDVQCVKLGEGAQEYTHIWSGGISLSRTALGVMVPCCPEAGVSEFLLLLACWTVFISSHEFPHFSSSALSPSHAGRASEQLGGARLLAEVKPL